MLGPLHSSSIGRQQISCIVVVYGRHNRPTTAKGLTPHSREYRSSSRTRSRCSGRPAELDSRLHRCAQPVLTRLGQNGPPAVAGRRRQSFIDSLVLQLPLRQDLLVRLELRDSLLQ